MGTGVSEALEGYIELAQWWIDSWGPLATKVAKAIDSGSYTADSAAADLASGVALAAETAFMTVNEALDVAAILAGSQDQPHIVRSFQFDTKAPSAAEAATPRSLKLNGPLLANLSSDSLPESCITIVPNPLVGSATSFHLVADATSHAGVTYFGDILVMTSAGIQLDKLTVWVTVP